MNKYLDEVSNLSWTLGGTGLVLITLSGSTLQWGIWITAISFIGHFVGFALRSQNSDSEQ